MNNFGIPTDEQWEKMKKFIKGDKYKKDDFFVFETLAVGDKVVPNRYTKLMPDLLQVMKEDADKGVSLMLNHNWSQFGVQSIPIGKVFSGEVREGSQPGETKALYVQQYILRDDSKVDGYSKNDIINLIESGILSDTSVGWGTTRDSYKCSICHQNYYSGKCNHWQGQKYIIDEGDLTQRVETCIVEAYAPKERHVGNNVLMENSVVFDGAYPNAVIQSAVGTTIDTPNGKFDVIEGKVELEDNDVILGYSTNGNIKLMYQKTSKKGGEDIMEKEKLNVTDEEIEKLNNEEVVEEVAEETNIEEVVEEAVNEEVAEETITQSSEEVVTEKVDETFEKEDIIEFSSEELSEIFSAEKLSKDNIISLLKEGIEYRNEAIEDALNSGVRALGNSFNKEAFKVTFANMSVKQIKELKEAWEASVDEQFSTERVSRDVKKEKKQTFVIKPTEELKTSQY